MARLKLPIKKEVVFKIRGQERRNKKKELNQYKSFVKNFWQYEDVDRMYGGGMSDEECNDIINGVKCAISIMEKELMETI